MTRIEIYAHTNAAERDCAVFLGEKPVATVGNQREFNDVLREQRMKGRRYFCFYREGSRVELNRSEAEALLK